MNCRNEGSLAQQNAKAAPVRNALAKGDDPSGKLPACPDADEEDGTDRSIPYPQPGATCRREEALGQAAMAMDITGFMERCPVGSKAQVLADGKTAAVAYPSAGYNCNKQF